MGFAEQIRQLRRERGLTQEQFAERLSVTRQAVSNWENDRNLPDIEMLIRMSRMFGVPLDQMILGGNGMAEKLIRDGSETRRARMDMISAVIGAGLMGTGLLCFLIKANSVEYIDGTGTLHENFYLVPVGYLFLLGGVLLLALAGAKYLRARRRDKAGGRDA
ncbi:MAG: helix-turn-helix domain-containing protein [Oscillospiraceae bacterium]|nr:helix-turn-helix domain-containing protein [Oscillospiraceae bacterium]